MSDFFIRLMKVTAHSEDVFTECLAETLRNDPEFRRGFLEKLCGPVIDGSILAPGAIDLETRVAFDGAVPDMVFRISGEVSIGVENKLESPEGKDDNGRTQLGKYLELVNAGELDRLAFITGYPTRVSGKVTSHKGYLYPLEDGEKQRDHFMWRDFYHLIEKRASRSRTGSVKALKSLFKYLGFEPPSPNIGDLNDPDPETARRNQRNFARFWDLMHQRLRERGWDIGGTGNSGFSVENGKADRLRTISINPQNGIVLRLYLSLRKGVSHQAVINDLNRLAKDYGEDLRVDQTTVRRPRGGQLYKPPVVRVLYPLRKLVEDKKRIAEKLAEIVLAVIDKAG
jgi:hypothetical protein